MCNGPARTLLLVVAIVFVIITGVAPVTAGGQAVARRGTATPATPLLFGIGHPTALTGHAGPVTALAWSPNGATLATSSDNIAADNTVDPTVRLWRPWGDPVTTLRGHTDSVTSLGWSPDGTILATGSRDHTVRLWSAQGDVLTTLGADFGQVVSLAWSPDGALLAVGSIAPWEPQFDRMSGVVRLIRQDGTLVEMLRTDQGGGKWLNLGWAPDGETLAAGAWGFRLWRRDGTLVAAIEREEPGGAPATAMAWSSDGRLLAIGDENGIVSLYAPTGQLLARISGNSPIQSLAFSPGGQTLAVMGGFFVWLVDTRVPGAQPTVVHVNRGSGGSNIAWSPDGGRLAGQAPDQVLRVWRADGALLATLAGCDKRVHVIAWSPDGQMLAAGSWNHTVCLWRWDDD